MTAAVVSTSRPALSPHVRLAFDRSRGKHVLLGPESVLVLNPPGASVVDLCDGRRTVAEIVANLRGRYDRVVDEEVTGFLDRLVRKRYVEVGDD
ncbi:pyrroloquinoline quinone biosynthesis peptide chaperone PqqD [Saccharopolyspora hirsuta]|uniref:Pyrroloquinoline quinone biosynthesis peptide chaperone PqqD n=1 Tax=Saccharopolyspora hirsuta TaxID=1837 RepID=A0A5M7BTJ0_SACHI|nr:pyrroloquinoline quinone biosynthesis peptide chaperone PqqD [Saccharopolyspora hirsuta]KAA5830544.1 pyrroloquinoline quinone biosynthesis peptide chaperone PqqD [Saccharopolyspora hirsuta]